MIACWTLGDEDWRLLGNKSGSTRLGFALLGIMMCGDLTDARILEPLRLSYSGEPPSRSRIDGVTVIPTRMPSGLRKRVTT